MRRLSWDLLLLAALQAALLGVGVALLVLRYRLVATRWPDIVQHAYNQYAHGLPTAMSVIGTLAVACSGLGAYATWKRRKLLLWTYAGSLAVLLGGVLFLSVNSLKVTNIADTWRLHDAIGSKEAVVANQFSSVYCAAQSAFVCDQSTPHELVATAGWTNITLVASNSSSGSSTKELLSVCGMMGHTNTNSTAQVCIDCVDLQPYKLFKRFAHWTQSSSCAFNTSTIAWCSEMLLSGDTNNTSTNGSVGADLTITDASLSPYELCRTPVLNLMSDWSKGVGIALCATCLIIVLLVVFAVLMQRPFAAREALDIDDFSELETNYFDKD